MWSILGFEMQMNMLPAETKLVVLCLLGSAAYCKQGAL